jgi:hypothetical protein
MPNEAPNPATATSVPASVAATAAHVNGPGQDKPGPPKFNDPVAGVLVQILPHFDKIRDDAEDAGRDGAYEYMRTGGTNSALKAEAVNLAARAELYNKVALELLNDPMLPADLAKWYHSQQD